MRFSVFLFLIFNFANLFAVEIKLPQRIYSPLFRDPGEVDLSVGPLLVDQVPVTNREFLAFVKTKPQFSKSKVVKLFADTGYLSQWTSNSQFLTSEANYPVTNVSWFIARRFCEAKNKRLPTIAEWEVFSDAQSPKHEKQILEWYAQPGVKLRNVGIRPGNQFGVKDAHDLIWEWVDNFSESIMSGDSRGGSSTESLFCGGAALKAKDPRLYASFIRFAFRSSLTATYTSANLGFRCVQDIESSH